MNADLDPRDFTMEVVLDRVERDGDLFEPVLHGEQSLKAALTSLESRTNSATVDLIVRVPLRWNAPELTGTNVLSAHNPVLASCVDCATLHSTGVDRTSRRSRRGRP